MIRVRGVFQAKYGCGDELVALFKESKKLWPDQPFGQIMVDLSGEFFTVVVETDLESLAAWEASMSDAFAVEGFAAWFRRMQEVVVSGRREFYRLVD